MNIGTAAWGIPREHRDHFPEPGSLLQRYSRVFNCVEVNSSFYKEHQAKTYARWASEVPDSFRFSVKLSKAFTHEQALKPLVKDVKESLMRILELERKLGVILIQLPGSLEFHPKTTERFFTILRKFYSGPLVIEPRNLTWALEPATKLMNSYGVSKVLADPERCPCVVQGETTYYRLHGSPVIYRSSYSGDDLETLARELSWKNNVWCIFDNTTLGKATENALTLKSLLS